MPRLQLLPRFRNNGRCYEKTVPLTMRDYVVYFSEDVIWLRLFHRRNSLNAFPMQTTADLTCVFDIDILFGFILLLFSTTERIPEIIMLILNARNYESTMSIL